MAIQRFPHIYLAGLATTEGFTSVQSGGRKPNIPQRDRQTHASRMERELEQAWKQAGDRQAVSRGTRTGHYLEFVSSPGFDLVFKSLEARRSGIQLLNVRKQGAGPNGSTLATVFIPSTKISLFLKKVQEYATQNTDKGKPKNAFFINSVNVIRDALLESFWTDNRKPIPDALPEWVEVWLSGDSDTIIEQFRATCAGLKIQEHPNKPLLRFPDRSVLLIKANRVQLAELLERSDYIAEFRAARETATFFLELENKDQAAWVNDLKGRLRIDLNRTAAVCILDDGLTRHPLFEGLLGDGDLHAAHPEWGTADASGHGTLMAGLAALGNLQEHLESGKTVSIKHFLESAKILPPPPEKNSKHLWGHVTARAVSEVEIRNAGRKRVLCMAVTAEDESDGGKPSSWSAEIDTLTSGADGSQKRLFLVSAGNMREPEDWKIYPAGNLTKEVEDPAQSWNSLTVGGCTFKNVINDKTLAGYNPIAEAGGLSPYSRTSLNWDSKWPIKPEVVFEAANIAIGPNNSVFESDDLQLISTWNDVTKAHFSRFGGTSAATASLAWMSAQIFHQYPKAWPETARGLIVHSAQWTQAMKKTFVRGSGKSIYKRLLRVCGYGVPDLSRALSCLKNSLTLVAQDELQPFYKKENRYCTKDMNMYRLPWPKADLLGLGETPVEMRVTLSYFIEPGPGEIGWKDRYRYASHGLRFELNSPGEGEDEFKRRINKQARAEEEGELSSDSPNDHWDLGQQRNVGSIHSDTWRGRAADLATSHLIAVRPSIGWWRERPHLRKWDKKCRYSLIISIHTPSETVDIYTAVAVQVGIATPIPIELQR